MAEKDRMMKSKEKEAADLAAKNLALQGKISGLDSKIGSVGSGNPSFGVNLNANMGLSGAFGSSSKTPEPLPQNLN